MNREEIIELARQTGFERLGHDDDDYVCYPDEIVAFATLIAEKTLEGCAKICEENANDLSEGDWDYACISCANNIRDQGL